MKATRVFLSLVFALAATALSAYGAAPCCTVTGINARTGMVTAKETATGRTFQFKVTDAGLLKTLGAGSPIYANFTTKQVSVNGLSPCCTIASLSAGGTSATSSKLASAPAAPAALVAPVSSATKSSVSAAAGTVSSSTSVTGSTAKAASTGFQCDSSGVCYCTGGKNSADCQALGGDPKCGTKIGCDGLGRCYCAPPVAKAW